MAKALSEARLTTRSARAELAEGTHWRGIDPDIHLGYRKARRGGRWLVRWYAGNQKYRQVTLGTADDAVSEGTLGFEQAVKLARETVATARRATQFAADGPAPTIRSVLETYIAGRNARLSAQVGRPRRSDAASRLELHVLKDTKLADTALSALSEGALSTWQAQLGPNQRGTSRERTVTDFKAALNAAYRTYRKQLPPDFGEIVRHGLSRSNNGEPPPPIARENQILPDEIVRRIILKAAELDPEGDLARFILVLAATGARFSQVQRMQVRDVQAEHSRLLVPKSRKGKGRTEGHYPVQVGRDVIAALAPVMSDRKPDEPLLCRWRHVQVSLAVWRRDRRGPWTSSAEITRPWRAICDALELKAVVPYALRHSSIVRGIRAGLPIRLVAALHDTSVAMIERHYARFIADGLEELAAKAVTPLVGAPGKPLIPSAAPGDRREAGA